MYSIAVIHIVPCQLSREALVCSKLFMVFNIHENIMSANVTINSEYSIFILRFTSS